MYFLCLSYIEFNTIYSNLLYTPLSHYLQTTNLCVTTASRAFTSRTLASQTFLKDHTSKTLIFCTVNFPFRRDLTISISRECYVLYSFHTHSIAKRMQRQIILIPTQFYEKYKVNLCNVGPRAPAI